MLSEYLRLKLSEKGWAIYHLHKVSAVSATYIKQIESGLKKKPSVEVLKKLAKAFNEDYEIWLEKAGYINQFEFNVKAEINFKEDVQTEINQLLKELFEVPEEKQVNAARSLTLILKGMKIQL